MLIRSLASNYLKKILRSPFGKWILGENLFAVILFWLPVLLYTFYIGFSIVRFLDIDRSVDLLASINPFIFHVFIIWALVDVLLFGRKTYVPLFPYLITPISRITLALVYQVIMILGKFNLLVLVFIAGFWVSNLYLQNIAFAWNWLLVLCLLCVCIHCVANILRSWRGEKNLPFGGTFLLAMLLVVIEWGYDVRILSRASFTLFDAATEGAVWPPVLMAGLAGLLFKWSTKRISRSLYIDYSLASKTRKKNRVKIFRSRVQRDLTSEMLHCEWKLVLRNRQPRSCLIMLITVTIFYAIINFGINIEMGAKNPQEIPIMFSVLLPTIYFVTAFDFRSSFYDKLQSIPVSSRMILKTIIFMSHRWTLVMLIFFVIVTIFSNVLYNIMIFPAKIFMIGIMLYGMGVINLATLFLSISSPTPRKLNVGLLQSNTFSQPTFINPQLICLFVFPIIFCGIPIILTKFIFNLSLSDLWSGLTMCLLGAIGLCIQPRFITLFAKTLYKRRYIIMKRFRLG